MNWYYLIKRHRITELVGKFTGTMVLTRDTWFHNRNYISNNKLLSGLLLFRNNKMYIEGLDY